MAPSSTLAILRQYTQYPKKCIVSNAISNRKKVDLTLADDTKWKRRSSQERLDPMLVYSYFPELFTLEINYDGVFTKPPRREYVDGIVTFADNVDMDLFSVLEVTEFLKQIGVSNTSRLMYHFCAPDGKGNLDYDLRPLCNDADVRNLIRYVPKFKVIKLYAEHLINENSVSKVVINQIDDNTPSPRMNTTRPRCKEIGSCSKILQFDLNHPVGSSQVIDVDCPVVQSKALVVYTPGKVVELGSQLGSQVVDLPDILNEESATPKITKNLAAEDELDFLDPLFDLGSNYVPYDGNIEDDYDVNLEAEYAMHQQDALGEEGEGSMEGLSFYGSTDVDSDSDRGSFGDSDDSVDDSTDDSGSYQLVSEDLITDVEVDMDDFHSVVDLDVDEYDKRKEHDDDSDECKLDVIDTDQFKFCGVETDLRRVMLDHMPKPVMCSSGKVHIAPFYIGQTFSSKFVVKERLTLSAIQTKRELHIIKNDKVRFRAVCDGKVLESCGSGPSEVNSQNGKGNMIKSGQHRCPWTLLVSKYNGDEDWMVKTFVNTHKCLPTRNIKSCTQSFLAKYIFQQLQSNPKIPPAALQEELQKKFCIQISVMVVFRAKVLALNRLHGDYEKQYTRLRDYVLELQDRNPGTTVKIQVESIGNLDFHTRQFRRIYICLGALKQGFRASQRELLGLDGAFMKGPYPGQVLTAVAIDGNNGTYPIAYAIVEVECTNSWTWFMECLGDDLDLQTNSNFTFITDRQKGLIPAIGKVFPSAEHRFCVRHIHENMKALWKGDHLRDAVWKCARATTLPYFNKAMEELKLLNPLAHDYLSKIPAEHWARSHFSGRAHSDLLLNNLCEVFNGKIVDGRDRPIISALEFIREYIMKRIVTVQRLIAKNPGRISPSAQKILDVMNEKATQCTCLYTGNGKYQVAGDEMDQFVVNMRIRECTCRKWELTGIPCKHAICALWDMAAHGENAGTPEDLVHPCYSMEVWSRVYSVSPGSWIKLLSS